MADADRLVAALNYLQEQKPADPLESFRSLAGLKDAYERRVQPIINNAMQTFSTGGAIGDLLRSYGEAAAPGNAAALKGMGIPFKGPMTAPREEGVSSSENFRPMGDPQQQFAGQLLGDPMNVQPMIAPAARGAVAAGKYAGPELARGLENYMVKSGGILPVVNMEPRTTNLIKDWRWRPLKDVSADLNIKEVPKYIQEGYGAFMAEQAKRAAAGDLGARDLIKAYGITRSSVNRAGRQMSDDLASGFTRPEGYMSEWFSSPAGKSYLDAAQSGKVDAAAIDDLVGRFQPFGMSQVLGKDLEYAAQKLPQVNGSINDLVQGSVPEWRKFAQGIYGIGPAKSGFLPSMLGRGDIPTLDARQLNLHTLDSGDSASKFMRRQGGTGGDQAVDRLASRQQKMNLEISPELQPFYQHLTHHAVWDKIGNSITTHSDIVKAMLTAGIAPVAIPGLVEVVMREKGIN